MAVEAAKNSNEMKLAHNGRSVVLPDFLMVGAAKSGTTTLYHYLNGHPEVFFPKNVKEPHYFSFGNCPPAYKDSNFVKKLVWKTEDYLRLYRESPHEAKAGDGSTSYLYKYESVIRNVQTLYGEYARQLPIVMVLRNPIDRAYSHYNFLIRNGWEHLPFETALRPEVMELRKAERWGFDYLGYGDYAPAVKAFQCNFDKVKIFLFEELANAENISVELCAFLGLSPKIAEELPRTNPSGTPKNKWLVRNLLRNKRLKNWVNKLPQAVKRSLLIQRDQVLTKVLHRDEMSHITRQQLASYYKRSVSDLEGLLGKNLNGWLEV